MRWIQYSSQFHSQCLLNSFPDQPVGVDRDHPLLTGFQPTNMAHWSGRPSHRHHGGIQHHSPQWWVGTYTCTTQRAPRENLFFFFFKWLLIPHRVQLGSNHKCTLFDIQRKQKKVTKTYRPVSQSACKAIALLEVVRSIIWFNFPSQQPSPVTLLTTTHCFTHLQGRWL